ncbi:hypothetical protein IKF76_01710 [Candidatus Saccharibacteria bacterium]|nr:hypothetical protein [Candidatus Saccharibacteria bacterium]
MRHTKKQVLDLLREFYAKNGYLPAKKDFCPPPDGWPWYQVICHHYGRFNDLLKEAFGEEYEELRKQTEWRRNRRQFQEIRKILKQEYWEETVRLGYPPTFDQVDANPGMHSRAIYSKYWRMQDLLAELGLEEFFHRQRSNGQEPAKKSLHDFTDDELIAKLRQLADSLGRTPTAADVNTSVNIPHSKTYHKHFGSFYRALVMAKLSPTPRQTAASKAGRTCAQQRSKNPA